MIQSLYQTNCITNLHCIQSNITLWLGIITYKVVGFFYRNMLTLNLLRCLYCTKHCTKCIIAKVVDWARLFVDPTEIKILCIAKTNCHVTWDYLLFLLLLMLDSTDHALAWSETLVMNSTKVFVCSNSPCGFSLCAGA